MSQAATAPKLEAKIGCCEEASPMSASFYIPCNAPASKIVFSPSDKQEYRMCAPCASHNVNNRGAEDRGPYDGPAAEATIGHNEPPSEFQTLKSEVDTFLKTADLWLAERPKITDGDTAKKAEDFDGQLLALKKKIEGIEEVEKRPYMNTLEEIRARFKGLSSRVVEIRTLFKARRDAWFDAEDLRIENERKQREEDARKAAEDAVEKRREAEEITAKAEAGELKGTGVSVSETLAAAAEAEEVAEQAQADYAVASNATASVRGDYATRTTTRKTVFTGTITDNGKLLAWVKKNRADELMAFLQGYADRAARSPEMRKSGLPGVEFVPSKRL